MNLNTPHGRAQAIADGGADGELARVVEAALESHSSAREAACWEQLNAIDLPSPDDALDLLETVDRLLREGDVEEALDLLAKAISNLEILDCNLDDRRREMRDAMEILEGKS